MLYPILVEYYLWFCFALLGVTWITRKQHPKLRQNLLYLYGMISVLGFLLALDWVAGVIFGLIVLEVGKVFKQWLDKKQAGLKK
ncbi:hypothetical protein [Marinomonas mediterranea]|uniref:Permease n=1 Tax=Marinomonas mediterranea (strain ATCC 700492 / JCM 21426 / NBRC 103028 / MMB-1) TaxID=717774 RepID=F2K2D4_MARM1|nr:hypothetical protein [Marinomonas mediterranea]ADZ92314.1 hypothetical protein Marme_3095 [Marinomonas mediterranea MMB-1]WCN10266.1 hypothetical protein GV055_15775 [Marinomonas mediterranea]WCN14313.1 hypothetical protein GV054_15590 [Marinomonas mediterranea]WCN18365.1 hypothetical protein GV053_15655 [Marinomonas mediterranea MMB-1]